MSSEQKNIFRYPELWIGSLGYFVDIYDLVLFGIVRVSSLRSIGVSEAELLPVGAMLLNFQMAGMLVGGFLWGILGDRRGRVSVLFGSIIVYSLANLLNAWVADVPTYALLRFIAGVGLAGELGAAVTLVSEILPARWRGYGSTVIGFAGFCGALAATLIGERVSWQAAYISGGVLGFLLLIARFKTRESPLMAKARSAGASFGSLRLLFGSWPRVRRYLHCVLLGVPIWFVSGILLYFAPEFGRHFALTGAVTAGSAIFWGYAGSIVGDVGGGFLSQFLRSRRQAVLFFLLLLAAVIAAYLLLLEGRTPGFFYGLCFLLGIGNGYWALLLLISAEQFGTNLRATAATSVPNVVRASVIPLSFAFHGLSTQIGLAMAALVLGVVVVSGSLWALSRLPETFSADLDTVEG